MANEITSSTTSTDQEKFLAAKLLARSHLRLVAASICDKVQQPKGAGLTAYFVRYKRMFVPLATLSEGVAPSNSTFTLEQVTVTLDQWGDVLTITDIAELTTKHPLVQQAIELLGDNANRVVDREVQLVWLAGTNVQYGDSSVTTRRTITTSMKISDTIIHRAVVTLVDAGAPTRNGPSGKDAYNASAANASSINGGGAYVGVCGPQVSHDIQAAGTSLGTWASVAMYNNNRALYNCEVGTWLGIRWVETNFIPKFTLLGNGTAAVVSAAAFGTDTPVVTAVDGGGTLTSSTTYFYKVTKKDKLRGFEESISIAHSTASAATANNESFTFNFSSLTAGFVYNLYFDSVQAGGTGTDATLGLVTANIAVGTTVTVIAPAALTTTPPDNVVATGNTVHPIFIFGAEACNWVGIQDLKTYMSIMQPTITNPLLQQRTIGYKFMAKAMRRDETRMLRVEVASTF